MSGQDLDSPSAKPQGFESHPLGRVLARHTFTLLLLLVFFAAASVGLFVIRDLRNASLQAQSMYAGAVVGLRQIGEMQYQVQETRRTTLYALTTKDANLQVRYADQTRAADRFVSEGIGEHLEHAKSSQERDTGRRLRQDWSNYLRVRDEVLASILEGSTREAVDLDLKGGVPTFDSVRQDLEDLKRIHEEEASEQLAAVDEYSRRSVFRLSVVLCLTLVFGGIAIWSIQRGKMLDALKQSEASLRASQERTQLLLDSTAEAIYGVDRQGNCTFINAACARLLGNVRPADLLGRNLHNLVHHTRADGTPVLRHDCKVCDVLEQGQAAHSEHGLFWRTDGTSFPAEYWSYPMRQGEVLVGAVVTFLDVTERKQLEDQLRQAQKMEAVGRLAGGIAHDFNNLLMVIRGYSELLLDRLAASEPMRANAEEIRKAAERATSLTQQLLAFSRMQMVQPKVLDMNMVVADMGKMLRHLIPAHIEVNIVPAKSVQGVKADRSQIEQVVLNLAINARDAMPDGGKLTIETATVELGGQHIHVRQHPKFRPGCYVALAVRDTGIGMDSETQAHIFEPFFTTKELGKGTGLGLATVYGIVKQSGGWIWVDSEPGEGSTFHIYLPKVEEVRTVEIRKAAAPAPRGAETILLVEDQEAVRDITRRFLESGGYKVLQAENGDEALRIASDHEGDIDVLISDMIMPKMRGPELARRIAGLRPGIKTIFISGYTEYSEDSDESEQAVLLMKPFERGELLRVVREVLDGLSVNSR